ncbi:MAG: SH3 domain-containing protein [Clostridium sp.]|nr:SH3 domain-containing protein [Clostridium sp.]MDY6229173.1 SH3 domain-containing protein [Clostridium sp.]
MKEYPEAGVFTCTVDAINFRNNPLISSSNPIQGQYYNGEKVNYDYVVITNKYVYISWISASAGVRRYMPVRDLINKEVWGTFV